MSLTIHYGCLPFFLQVETPRPLLPACLPAFVPPIIPFPPVLAREGDWLPAVFKIEALICVSF